MASHFVSLSKLATLGIDFSVFSFCYGTRNQRSDVGVCEINEDNDPPFPKLDIGYPTNVDDVEIGDDDDDYDCRYSMLKWFTRKLAMPTDLNYHLWPSIKTIISPPPLTICDGGSLPRK
ncbi:hypothetical protein DAPPUDRAFT_117585 [Daphnia pulex]|uniref:Uncharacterized protein n=1 Tax=Daphnia pulex TaxID=6669 RepID=E9HT68_DAPPU|nr:hypothetical protein DAPPUDRAFT_117585 [Daphnia pulex]|eukprot:EFX65066.1 hypothetical protein DAPPUDRAFT_117585 [Daphnia pulex]